MERLIALKKTVYRYTSWPTFIRANNVAHEDLITHMLEHVWEHWPDIREKWVDMVKGTWNVYCNPTKTGVLKSFTLETTQNVNIHGKRSARVLRGSANKKPRLSEEVKTVDVDLDDVEREVSDLIHSTVDQLFDKYSNMVELIDQLYATMAERRVSLATWIKSYRYSIYNRRKLPPPVLKTINTTEQIRNYLSGAVRLYGLALMYYQISTLVQDGPQDMDSLPEDRCVCCFDEEIELMFYPCHHRSVCKSCYKQLKRQECPMCRTPIENVKDVSQVKDL